LRFGNQTFAALVGDASLIDVAKAGTLDLHGFILATGSLEGAGTIFANAASSLTVHDGEFSGAINGAIHLTVESNLRLSGGGTFTMATIEANAQLELVKAAHEDVVFDGTDGALVLDTPGSFTGTIEGMIQTDVLDFTTIDFGGSTHLTFDKTTDILTLS